MSEEINEIEKNNRKNDAEHMHKSDVVAIITGYSDLADEAAVLLSYARSGVKYKEAGDAIVRLAEQLQNGPHVAFARKNKWLKEYREDFLRGTGDEQTPEDRKALVALFDMANSTSGFASSFAKFVNKFTNDVLWRAYHAIRFFNKMKESYKEEDMARIRNAFAEYDSIFKRYNDASIYRTLRITADKPFEVNYEAVLDHMDDALASSTYVCEFLLNTKQAAAYEVNRLHALDRDTYEFHEYGEKESLLRDTLKEAEGFRETLAGYYAAFAGTVSGYLDCYTQIIEGVTGILERALEVIGDFRSNSSEAPYAVMHYDSAVTKVAGSYLFMSLGDPLERGTRYNEMAMKMLQRCRELAKSVAKAAPRP